jgi:4-hydroxy-tetrahydrodipicolinate synthase
MFSVLGEVLTAIVTPFNTDGSVNVEGFQELARFLVDHGSDGLVVAGSTGESATLTDAEKLTVFGAAVDAVGDRASVVAGTGTYSTAHSVRLTEEAHELGVDGFLVVTPYYNKPPQRGIVEHFKAIAAASDKPIIAYNIPGRVVIQIESETFLRLAEIPTLTMVKQAWDDLEQARFIVDEAGLALYAGDDPNLLPFLRVGGIGVISVTSHIVGERMKELVGAFRSGDPGRAAQIDAELAPAYDLLKVQTNPIPIKAALNLLGHDVGGYRLPLVDPTQDEEARVRDCLERLGILAAAAA